MYSVIAFSALVAVASAAAFSEDFGAGWEDRWSQASKEDLGKFVSSAGKYFNDAEADAGIKTSEDAKFYGLGAKFESFSNEGKTMIVQFRVKHEQNIDCGGGYVKIFPSTQEVTGVSDGDEKAPYNLMFGPDICGPGTRKVHVIFNYKGENKLTKSSITCKSDEASHLYTLIVSPDNTYEVQIDGEKEHSGSIYDDFDMLKAKEINDPEVSKPDDWVDETMIDDPEDVKPDDWVTEKQIVDPEAEQPEDWDEEMDGEWEAPTIDNPEFKGEFSAKRIDNPEYKGEWVHPQVANPEYEHDDALYDYSDFGVIGFDLWQVKAGTIFDNVLITSDEEEAAAGVAAFKTLAEGEKAAKDAADEKKKAEEEAAKAEEEAAKAAEEANEEEEEEEEDETGDAEPVKDEL
jgi:calreticulin